MSIPLDNKPKDYLGSSWWALRYVCSRNLILILSRIDLLEDLRQEIHLYALEAEKDGLSFKETWKGAQRAFYRFMKSYGFRRGKKEPSFSKKEVSIWEEKDKPRYSKECLGCRTRDGIMTFHHVIPRRLGGTLKVPLCVLCHADVENYYLLNENQNLPKKSLSKQYIRLFKEWLETKEG